MIAAKYGSTSIVTPSLVFLSGVTAKNELGEWVEGTIREHTKLCLETTQKRLQHIGLDLSDREFIPLREMLIQQSSALQCTFRITIETST